MTFNDVNQVEKSGIKNIKAEFILYCLIVDKNILINYYMNFSIY